MPRLPGYTPLRRLLETMLGVAYRGNWPGAVWGSMPGALDVAIQRRTYAHPEAPRVPCRVAFASDLHVGPTTPVRLLENAFREIRDFRPDVLLLGGDYVFLEANATRLRLLRELVASVPCAVKFAVLGNHDVWTHHSEIARALEAAGARMLINDCAQLPDPFSAIEIVGLADPWTQVPDPAAALRDASETAFRIVLCHAPDGLLAIEAFRFDLFLAGHTHGGQIATPWGAVIAPFGRLSRKHLAGFSRFGVGDVYVSRGLGGVELPIRTFAPPDVLFLEIGRSVP